MDSTYKYRLTSFCTDLVQQQLNSLQQELDNAKKSANADTKSSMGDKYETSRAMLQIEQEKLIKQAAEIQGIKNQLERVNTTNVTNVISFGSVVETSLNTIFLVAALGKISFEGNEIIVISTSSPIGKLLLEKRVGESVQFNKMNLTIKNIL